MQENAAYATLVVVSTAGALPPAGNAVQVEAAHLDGAAAVAADVFRPEALVARMDRTVTLDKSVSDEATKWVVAKTILAAAKVTINKDRSTNISRYTFQIP